MAYYYDAVGNITSTVDTATQSVYFSATSPPVPATADQDFTYDAIYRLIEATGREHSGGAADVQFDEIDVPIKGIVHPNNPQGMRGYKETYTYDKVGNFTAFKHEATSSPTAPTWTRNYTYVTGTNQLDTITHPLGTRNFPRDAHGNITAMSHLTAINWDYLDQMRRVEKSGGGDAELLRFGRRRMFRMDAPAR